MSYNETATESYTRNLNTVKDLKLVVNALDEKFSKAITEVLCSIGELRHSREEYEQQTDGYLNEHDMKIQALESQVKKLFARLDNHSLRIKRIEDDVVKEKMDKVNETSKQQYKPIFEGAAAKQYKIRTLVGKLQDAIIEYNRG